MKKLFNIFNKFYYRMISPNLFASKVGVVYGNNCKFRTKKFGTEPYLIKTGNNVHTASGVVFLTHDGGVHCLRNLYDNLHDVDLFGKIEIGNNVFIGQNAVILYNTKIGDNVIIGANSLVKGIIQNNSVYAGSPAKFISSMEHYLEKNIDKLHHTKKLSSEEKKKYLERINL